MSNLTAMDELPSRAEAMSLARELLAALGSRLQHTEAVAARAEELALAAPTPDRHLLVVAAWWHDLGYAPETRVGFNYPLTQLTGPLLRRASVLMRSGSEKTTYSVTISCAAAVCLMENWAQRKFL